MRLGVHLWAGDEHGGSGMKAVALKWDGECYRECGAESATHLLLHMPGPIPDRMIPVGNTGWSWNLCLERVTLHPSIRTIYPHADGEILCHSFVRDGVVEFLSDCTHELAGKNVPLLEVEWEKNGE